MTPLLLILFAGMSKNLDLGTPFKIQWAPEWYPKSTKWLQQTEKKYQGGQLFREPRFHDETIVITVPLGHRGFFKYIISMEIGSFSVMLRFVVLCFIQHVYHLFS